EARAPHTAEHPVRPVEQPVCRAGVLRQRADAGVVIRDLLAVRLRKHGPADFQCVRRAEDFAVILPLPLVCGAVPSAVEAENQSPVDARYIGSYVHCGHAASPLEWNTCPRRSERSRTISRLLAGAVQLE